MIRVIPNAWKSTIGIFISIDRGACFEDKKTLGYTHIAEHLLFSGTEKRSRHDFRDMVDRIFNGLEATTGYEEVRLFCYVDKSDFAEAIRVLHELIYNWKCRKEVFQGEKEDLLNEYRAYYGSDEARTRREVTTMLFSRPREVLGTLSDLKTLRFADIAGVKAHWNNFLAGARMDVCLLGAVDTKEKELTRRLFPGKISREQKVDWVMKETRWVESAKGAGIKIEHNTRHPYLLFIGQILGRRLDEQMDQCISFHHVQWTDESLLCGVSTKPSDKNSIRALLKKPLTKKEFEIEKGAFLKRFRHALEGIDPIDTLHWFHGFRRSAYRTLSSDDPKAIYRLYQRMTFAQVKQFFEKILREADQKRK